MTERTVDVTEEFFLKILIMLMASNGAPIIAARLLGSRANTPVDFRRKFRDGNAVFGRSKTWRGLLAAILISGIASQLLGLGLTFGLVFGGLAMLGDLASSFIKRRCGMAPSDRSAGLDQLPEALLPALYCCAVFNFSWWWALVFSLAFALLHSLISWPLFLLHIRKRPY